MNILTIANESIAFQNDVLFKNLTLIVEDARASKADNDQVLAKYFLRIDKAIYDSTGILTDTKIMREENTALIILPALTKGNVLHKPNFRKFLQKHWDNKPISFLSLEQKGWIDPSQSKVGGAFSEIMFKMFIGGDLFTSDEYGKSYTAEEAAAAIIHEVGHAYGYLQFLADKVVINNVLLRTYQELTNGNVDKKVKITLTSAANDMRIKGREWLECVSDDTDPEVAYNLLTSAVLIEERNLDNKRFYTQYAFEEIADIFATRHGAGRAIVSLRSKNDLPTTSTSSLMLNSSIMFISLLLMPVISPGFGAGALIAFIGTLLDISAIKEIPDITKFKQSAQKVRNQMVEKIKQSRLPKEDIAAILEDIEYTDNLIQNYQADTDPPAVQKLINMFQRGKMEARASREYTDKLEVLAANNLFVRAAQFATR